MIHTFPRNRDFSYRLKNGRFTARLVSADNDLWQLQNGAEASTAEAIDKVHDVALIFAVEFIERRRVWNHHVFCWD